MVVPVKRSAAGERVLGLPKGHLDGGETALEAAVREVREEAGVTGELVAPLGAIDYTYERRGRRIDKRVEFFLFEYGAGNPANHDHEIEEARWMPLEEALHALTYPAEREIVERALSRLARDV